MRISDLKKIFRNAYAAYFTLTNGVQVYQLTVAITANSTLTSAPAGSFGVTSHDTGKGLLFYSDGTKWQASDATALPVKATGAEINTGTDDAKFATAKAITDSNVAFVADIPVKASGAEVDTGTDDAKFLTPKAIEDSAYAKTTDITAAAVGLGNVNNTADAAKPVSTAQQTALDLKLDKDISALDAATPAAGDFFVFRTVGGVLKKIAYSDLAAQINV